MTERGSHPGLQHPDQELLVDVALGQADLPDRQEVAGHLAVCARCRLAYDELAGPIELVLPAIPRVAPPPDFERSVLARLDERRSDPGTASLDPSDPARPGPARPGPVRSGSRSSGSVWAAPQESGSRQMRSRRSGSRRSGPRRTGTRRLLAPVAAGLIGLAAGAGLSAVVLDRPDPDTTVTAMPAVAPIITADGESVGAVSRTIADGAPALVVALDDGPIGGSYTCRLVLTDGTVQDVGEWKLREDGVNSWVVGDPGVRRVELIGDSGRVWSSADL